MIKLAIFDLDDTLFLNESVFWEIENKIAKDLGFAPISIKAHRLTWGIPTKERLARNFPNADKEIFMETLLKFIPKLVKKGRIDVISDKNAGTLKKLKNNGKNLAILTSRTAAEVTHFLDKNHQMNKWIEKIYHVGNLEHKKPDPKVFGHILSDFGVQPQEAVYVGDLASDAECAKGAGINFIAVLENGLRTRKNFKPRSVDFFANTFSDIVDYILSN